MQRETLGRRVMCIMEGEGVDDEFSQYRNAFVSVFEYVSLFSLLLSLVLSCLVLSCLVLSCLVLSCLVLSCLVLSCLVLSCLVLSCLVLSCLVLWCVCVGVRVCWRVCVLARSTLPAVSLRRAGVQQLYQVQRMIGGIGNMLFSSSQTLNV